MRYFIILLSTLLLSITSGCTDSTVGDKADASNTWLFIMFVLLLIINIILLIVAVIIPLRKYPNREKIIYYVLDDHRTKDFIRDQIMKCINFDYANKEKAISQPVINEKKINEIVDIVVERAMECINLEQNKQDEALYTPHSTIIEDVSSNQDAIYFRSKQELKLLEEVNKAEGVFKVFNIKNNEANFEYCGGVVNPDFFEKVCVFANNPHGIQVKSIKTVVPGKVTKDDNGNWVIVGKAEIKFE